LAVILALFYLSLIALIAFFNESSLLAFSLPLAPAAAVFTAGLNVFTIAGAIAVFLAGLVLNLNASSARMSLIKPSVRATLSGLSSTITLFSLAIALVYFPQTKTMAAQYKLKISDQAFDKIYESLTSKLNQDGAGTEETIKQTAQKYFDSQIPQIRNQLVAQGFTGEAVILDQINKARAEYLKQVLQNSPATGNGDAQVQRKLIKDSVEDQLNSAIDSNREWLPYVLSASLFFSVTFFSFLISWALTTMVWTYVFIFKLLGIAKITITTVESQKIIIN